MVLVSVCVNVYNREETIKQCLDSIVNQTHKELEIIVVDDASTDNSIAIIEDNYSKNNKIRILKNSQNLGPTRSAEKAYDVAKGDYLCTVDSDDYIELNCIKRCLQSIGKAGLVYTYCRHFGSSNKADTRAKYSYSKEALLNFFMVFHFRMFKRELWDQVKYFSVNRYCYDYELVVRLSEITEFVLLPEYLYWWRRHEDQTSVSKNNVEKLKEYRLVQYEARIRRGLLHLE